MHFCLKSVLCGFGLAASTLAFSQKVVTAPEFPISSTSIEAGFSSLPDAPQPQQTQVKDPNSKQAPANEGAPKRKQQPKRILGIMPNYRAVSAGAIPPPPTAKQAFKIATQNSFDYSSFVFVGLTSMIAEGEDTHKSFGKGVPGFWSYYWRGFLDKTDGNYWVIFALPTVLHEDERYYAKGEGPLWKRGAYSSTRVFITPNYHGKNTVNASELVGRAIAQEIGRTYYPSADSSAGALAQKWGYAILRDAMTNTFREFWPDIAEHVLHRNPRS
jgi:hypothetical protein